MLSFYYNLEKVSKGTPSHSFIKKDAPHDNATHFVFRTSIKSKFDVVRISELFKKVPEILQWHIDLKDREKVMYLKCIHLKASDIRSMVQKRNIDIEEMPI
ncbi:MAG: hypothetical protein FH748_03830 [Balneolaceae bacterium]|nr:hypothetical protein [Balneolaceae bacterium]